jgi:hypothetical protein
MKLFKGKSTELYCGHCARWILLQKVVRVAFPKRPWDPWKFTDGKIGSDFERIYECPLCGGIILRCPK